MGKRNFLRGGEIDKPYASPQLELLEIALEQGFAGSWGDGSLDEDWDDLGEI